MVDVATRRFPEIPFRRADILNLDYEPGGLDAIWAAYSLIHMVRTDFEVALEKIRSALVVGGVFGLTMQEGQSEVRFHELLLPGKNLLV